MRTLKELAQEALDVQNASNLSGIVHSFSRAITDLREAAGSAYSNTHPINILWSDKIAHLTGTQNLGSTETADAYMAVYKIIEA